MIRDTDKLGEQNNVGSSINPSHQTTKVSPVGKPGAITTQMYLVYNNEIR